MKYMMDTDTCIELIRQKNGSILRRLKRRNPEDVCVSAVTLSELEYGVAKSSNPSKNRLALAEFMTPIAVLPYDDQAANSYGIIRAQLESDGTPIGPLDNMIAAHALALGLVVVTNNEREFCRVKGLKVQNWTK